jgi:uncharacterized membrane protein YeaQ/YmgE (transglycosylase-associated protein family)
MAHMSGGMDHLAAVVLGMLILVGSVALTCFLVGAIACALTASPLRWPGKMGLGLAGAFLGSFGAASWGLEPRSEAAAWVVLVAGAVVLVWATRLVRGAFGRRRRVAYL